ncbi:MAG: methyltransferase domain-containing protein [Actinomycetota bacterium]
MGSTDHEPVNPAVSAALDLDGDPGRVGAFYDRWAADYDHDVTNEGYGLPAMVVETVKTAVATGARSIGPEEMVIDAGCGTGLVGLALHDAGHRNIHGLDLSAEMAAVARSRGVYATVVAGYDLTGPVPDDRLDSAALVVVGGVFTLGHVPPETLGTVAALVRDGGLLVVSTRRAYQDQTSFVEVQRRLVDDGVLELRCHLIDRPYTADSTGDYWAWTVTGAAS